MKRILVATACLLALGSAAHADGVKTMTLPAHTLICPSKDAFSRVLSAVDRQHKIVAAMQMGCAATSSQSPVTVYEVGMFNPYSRVEADGLSGWVQSDAIEFH